MKVINWVNYLKYPGQYISIASISWAYQVKAYFGLNYLDKFLSLKFLSAVES